MTLLFVFPRLDRPSVVGDEGRPRAASLTIASLVVFVLAVVGGALLGDASLVMTVGTATGTTIGGLALLGRERFAHMFVGTLLAVPIGAAMTWQVALTLLAAGDVLVGLGLTLALFGIGLTWADVGDREAVGTVTKRVGIGYVGLLFGGLIPVVILGIGVYGADSLLAQESASSSVSSFLLVGSVLAGAVYAACAALPLDRLAPRDRRDALTARVARVRRVALWVAVGAFALIVPAAATVPSSGPGASTPAVVEFFQSLSSPLVVVPLLGVAAVVGLVAALGWLGKWIVRSESAGSQRQVAAFCAGIFVGTILLGVGWSAPWLITTALLLLLLGPLLFLAAVVAVIVLIDLGLLPSRGGGLALAAAGLGTTTLGAGLGGFAVPFVFACAAGTVIVWDVSTYGMGLTAELGHVPETRRLELVHAVAVVGLGVLAVALASGLYLLRTTVGVETGATAAMAVAALGALIAVVPLRG